MSAENTKDAAKSANIKRLRRQTITVGIGLIVIACLTYLLFYIGEGTDPSSVGGGQATGWGSCGAPKILTVDSGSWSARIRGRKGCYWYIYRSPGSGVGEIRANGSAQTTQDWTHDGCVHFDRLNYLEVRLKQGEPFEATFRFLEKPKSSTCS